MKGILGVRGMMSVGFFVFITVLIIMFAKIMKAADNFSSKENRTNEQDGETFIDLSAQFFSEVKSGEKPYRLMNIYNQFDLMFIRGEGLIPRPFGAFLRVLNLRPSPIKNNIPRGSAARLLIKSFFQSEAIPYRIENEFTSRIRPGMQVGSFRAATISILEKDYVDAVKIIEHYQQSKKNNYKQTISVRKPMEIFGGWGWIPLFEFIFGFAPMQVLFGGGWTVPGSKEIDGIEINRKKALSNIGNEERREW
jgi:hypothetical protein